MMEFRLVLFERHLGSILLKTGGYYDLEATDTGSLEDEKDDLKQEDFHHGLIPGLMIHLTEGSVCRRSARRRVQLFDFHCY